MSKPLRHALLAVLLTALALSTATTRSDPPAATQSAPAIATGLRMCTCTHSFHVFVPPGIVELAELAGIKGHTQLQTSMIGGSFVSQHWDSDRKVKAALVTGRVDVLTLSPIYLPDEGIDRFVTLALQSNPDTRILLQQSWLPWDDYDPKTDHGIAAWRERNRDHPARVDHNAMPPQRLQSLTEPYSRELTDYVRTLNQKLGKQAVFIVPAGQAVQALRAKIFAGQAPGLKTQEELFGDALGHPKPVLAALVCYTNFAVIYRQTPVGLPKPKALRDCPDELNRLLQELAWRAATAHPLSGLTVTPQP
jgi:hypothetical protein